MNADARDRGGSARFLMASELDALRAVTARLIPGPPEDPDPGALEACAAEAIDSLLGALSLDPAPIHAGGPFSHRAGARDNEFAQFVALDRAATLGWRIRLEGSGGLPEREFGGAVVGLQEIYRDGLAQLERRMRAAHGVGFTAASTAQQDELLDDADADIQAFVAVAMGHTLEAVYGPPEYGGNRDLVGWISNAWQGDTQPRGFSRAQVTEPDRGAGDGAGSAHAALTAIRSRLTPDAGWRAQRRPPRPRDRRRTDG